MLKRMIIVVIALMAFAVGSQAAKWEIDKAHSSVGFSVSHLVISKTKGYFDDYSGNIEFEVGKFDIGKVEMTVDVASIDTDDAKRDDHLRSPDFFDAATFPKMTFVSKKVFDVTEKGFKMTGDLTIRDVSREVTFDCEFHGVMSDPMGNTKAGFSAATKINRQDFNVKWNMALDAGGLVVGDEVDIILELELGMVK